MKITGVSQFRSGRPSASEEVHWQLGPGGRDHELRSKPDGYSPWLAIDTELIPQAQVQEQLEMVTKKVAQDRRRADFNTVPVGDRLKTEDAPMQYNMWSTDPAAIPLPRGIQRG